MAGWAKQERNTEEVNNLDWLWKMHGWMHGEKHSYKRINRRIYIENNQTRHKERERERDRERERERESEWERERERKKKKKSDRERERERGREIEWKIVTREIFDWPGQWGMCHTVDTFTPKALLRVPWRSVALCAYESRWDFVYGFTMTLGMKRHRKGVKSGMKTPTQMSTISCRKRIVRLHDPGLQWPIFQNPFYVWRSSRAGSRSQLSWNSRGTLSRCLWKMSSMRTVPEALKPGIFSYFHHWQVVCVHEALCLSFMFMFVEWCLLGFRENGGYNLSIHKSHRVFFGGFVIAKSSGKNQQDKTRLLRFLVG